MLEILISLAPNYLKQMFNVCDNERYNLRSNQIHLSLERPKTNSFLKFFSQKSCELE